MMKPFSVHGEMFTHTHTHVFTVGFTHRRVCFGVKSLSSNLYDGLNNYFAFSAQFVDEPAPYLCC